MLYLRDFLVLYTILSDAEFVIFCLHSNHKTERCEHTKSTKSKIIVYR